MIALGLASGECVLKQAETILRDNYIAKITPTHIAPDEENKTQEISNSLEKAGSLGDSFVKYADKVTQLSFLNGPPRILFGSKDGFLTQYNISKKETISFPIHSKNMKKII